MSKFDSKELCLFLTGFAPFLSMSKRESFLTVNEQVAVAPGPGYYTPPSSSSSARTNKGGASLQNRVSQCHLFT